MTRPEPGPDTGPGSRFRLLPWVEPFQAPDGALYLISAAGDDATVADPDEIDRALLGALAGGVPRDLEDLSAACDGAERCRVEEKLTALVDFGVVVEEEPEPELDGDDEERFSRQLPFFAVTGAPRAAQRRLRAATVVVLGCGGVGTWALAGLCAAGVGRFLLIDDDRVELSNLNRQILYSLEDVGTPKVQACAAWVRRFDPAASVTTIGDRIRGPDQLQPLVSGADALVMAADWPAYQLGRWVNEACLAKSVPWITAGQLPPLLRVGPTYLPWRGPCFACHEQDLRRSSQHYDSLAAHRAANASAATTLGPASGMASSAVALEVMQLLLDGGEGCATAGRALLMDMRTFETEWETIPRDPACVSCGAASMEG